MDNNIFKELTQKEFFNEIIGNAIRIGDLKLSNDDLKVLSTLEFDYQIKYLEDSLDSIKLKKSKNIARKIIKKNKFIDEDLDEIKINRVIDYILSKANLSEELGNRLQELSTIDDKKLFLKNLNYSKCEEIMRQWGEFEEEIEKKSEIITQNLVPSKIKFEFEEKFIKNKNYTSEEKNRLINEISLQEKTRALAMLDETTINDIISPKKSKKKRKTSKIKNILKKIGNLAWFTGYYAIKSLTWVSTLISNNRLIPPMVLTTLVLAATAATIPTLALSTVAIANAFSIFVGLSIGVGALAITTKIMSSNFVNKLITNSFNKKQNKINKEKEAAKKLAEENKINKTRVETNEKNANDFVRKLLNNETTQNETSNEEEEVTVEQEQTKEKEQESTKENNNNYQQPINPVEEAKKKAEESKKENINNAENEVNETKKELEKLQNKNKSKKNKKSKKMKKSELQNKIKTAAKKVKLNLYNHSLESTTKDIENLKKEREILLNIAKQAKAEDVLDKSKFEFNKKDLNQEIKYYKHIRKAIEISGKNIIAELYERERKTLTKKGNNNKCKR